MATAYAASGREMTVGGVLARAFAAIGAAPVRFLGTSLVLSALPYALSTMIGRSAMRASTTASIGAVSPASALSAIPWGLLSVVWIGYFILYLVAKTILIRTAVAAEGEGRGETFGGTVAAAVRVLLPLAAATMLYFIGIWLGMILLIVPGVILALMWAVTGPVLVNERIGVFAAFGRSRRLTKGARLRIMGLVIVVFAVYLVFAFALGFAGHGLSGFGAASAAASRSAVQTVLTAVIQTVFFTVWSAVQASLYLELRDWKDGVAGDRLADIFA